MPASSTAVVHQFSHLGEDAGADADSTPSVDKLVSSLFWYKNLSALPSLLPIYEIIIAISYLVKHL